MISCKLQSVGKNVVETFQCIYIQILKIKKSRRKPSRNIHSFLYPFIHSFS